MTLGMLSLSLSISISLSISLSLSHINKHNDQNILFVVSEKQKRPFSSTHKMHQNIYENHSL